MVMKHAKLAKSQLIKKKGILRRAPKFVMNVLIYISCKQCSKLRFYFVRPSGANCPVHSSSILQ